MWVGRLKQKFNCSMTENIPPKRVSLSDLSCIFAMFAEDLFGF